MRLGWLESGHTATVCSGTNSSSIEPGGVETVSCWPGGAVVSRQGPARGGLRPGRNWRPDCGCNGG